MERKRQGERSTAQRGVLYLAVPEGPGREKERNK